ncbi:MAG: hypothetical protein ACOVO1_12645 [Chitinophagaceae bacterium]
MKNAFLLFVLLFTSNLIFAQKDTLKSKNWEEYFEMYNKSKDGYNYVYYYNTKGGEKIKSYHYFKCNNEFILTYKNYQDSTFSFFKLKSDTLFNYLEKNFSIIKKFYKKFKPENFRNQFDNKDYNMIQVGIRFKDLHFNHFQPISDLELSEMPLQDEYTKGQLIINELATFFEKKFTK